MVPPSRLELSTSSLRRHKRPVPEPRPESLYLCRQPPRHCRINLPRLLHRHPVSGLNTALSQILAILPHLFTQPVYTGRAHKVPLGVDEEDRERQHTTICRLLSINLVGGVVEIVGAGAEPAVAGQRVSEELVQFVVVFQKRHLQGNVGRFWRSSEEAAFLAYGRRKMRDLAVVGGVAWHVEALCGSAWIGVQALDCFLGIDLVIALVVPFCLELEKL
jgi:hypothetical protein